MNDRQHQNSDVIFLESLRLGHAAPYESTPRLAIIIGCGAEGVKRPRLEGSVVNEDL